MRRRTQVDVTRNMDPEDWLRKHLDDDGSGLLGEMVGTFAEQLMAAEVDALCDALPCEVSMDRVNAVTAGGPGTSTLEWDRPSSPCPDSARASGSRIGCSSPDAGPSGPSPRWWRCAT
jgi:hypothetical protein